MKPARTIRIDVMYEGGDYVGWQRQARGRSVQGCLEKALSQVADERVTLFGASRTDAGVHARQQVASFSLARSRTPAIAFVAGTNRLLPDDIRVMRSVEADPAFLANRDARRKCYRYFLRIGRDPNVFLRRYAWHLRIDLEWRAVKKATKELIGTRDFAAFRTSGYSSRTSERTVYAARWGKAPAGLRYFEIEGDGFLKQMVRGIVGTLVEIGQGKRQAQEMAEILASGKRARAGQNAPARGLFLWSVRF